MPQRGRVFGEGHRGLGMGQGGVGGSRGRGGGGCGDQTRAGGRQRRLGRHPVQAQARAPRARGVGQMNVEVLAATIQQPGGKRRAESAEGVRGESGQRIANRFGMGDVGGGRGGDGAAVAHGGQNRGGGTAIRDGGVTVPAQLTQQRALGAVGQGQQRRIAGGGPASAGELGPRGGVVPDTGERDCPQPGFARIGRGGQPDGSAFGMDAAGGVGEFGVHFEHRHSRTLTSAEPTAGRCHITRRQQPVSILKWVCVSSP